MTSPFSSPRPQYPQAPRGFQSPQPPNGSRSRIVLLLAGLIVVVVVAAVIVAALLFTRSSRTVSEPATTSGGARVTGTPNEASAPAAGAPSRAPSAPAQSAPGPTPTVESTSAPSVTDPTTLTAMHAEVTRDPNDPRAKGDVNAPVVMVIYSDFACPFCTQFAQNVEPELNKLVKEGTLRIEWRDLAQVTQTSPLAAQAGIAAGKQGKFWEFHDAVYAAADPKGHPAYTEDSLVDFAKKAGVPDLKKFRTDMTAAETVKAVAESTNHVHSIGIQGTPFMIVGETYINGYKDANYMTAVVKSQAAKAKEAKGAQAATGAASPTSPAAPAR